MWSRLSLLDLLVFDRRTRRLEHGPLDRGVVLARRLGISQPRVTQVLNLTRLCPAIQAEVVVMEAVDGVEPMTERLLREVLREVGWVGQWKGEPLARTGGGL